MIQGIATKRFLMMAVAAATLALGGCATTGGYAPTSASYGSDEAVPYEDRGYDEPNNVGGHNPATDEAWTAHRNYEYRGGRNAETGKANIQM
jgi:hypothetical protein